MQRVVVKFSARPRWAIRCVVNSARLRRARKMKYFVYVLKSKIDKKFYTGYSEDPVRRLKEHNSGRTRSLFKRRPLTMVYQEEYTNELEARRRERFLKSGQGRKFLRAVVTK